MVERSDELTNGSCFWFKTLYICNNIAKTNTLRLKFSILQIMVFMLVMLSSAGAQAVKLSGRVIDKESGEYLQGAVVYIHETGKHSVCNQEGEFALENLRPGVYHIHCSMLSYEPYARDIRVFRDTVVRIEMEPTSIELKNFTVEADLMKTEAVKNSLNIESADRDFIEKQAGNTFSNALEKIPGISSANVGVGIAKPVIRGMSSNRVLVTENGIKQEGQQWGSDHGLELDQYNVDRVEILKGPATLLYGSDAIGGVINILPPPIPMDGKLNLSALGFFKSNNNAYGSSLMAEGSKKKYFFRARATWQEFGDYKVPADSFTYNTYRLPIYNQHLKNTAGNELNFSLSGGLMRDWGMLRVTASQFSQEAGLFPGATGIPRAYSLLHDNNYRNIDLPRQLNTHRKFLLNLNIKTKKGWWENDLGYQINFRREEAPAHAHGYVPDENNTTALGLDLQTLTFNSRLHSAIRNKIKTVLGVHVQNMHNAVSGFEFLLPSYNSWQTGAYYFLEYRKNDRSTYNTGLRADFAHFDFASHRQPVYDNNQVFLYYNENSPAFQRNFLNWSAAAGASFEPSHEFNIKLNASRSFRFPNAAELSANGVHHGTFRHEMGDSSLLPEVGYQMDLGLILHEKHYIFKLTPFFNYFSNYLFLRPNAEFSPLPGAGQIYRFTQAEVIYAGLEFYGEMHFIESLHLECAAEYVYNYNFNSGLPLPFTPPGSVSFGPEYSHVGKKKIKSWFIASEIKYYFAQSRTDRNENTTPAYYLLSASAGIELSIGKQKMELMLRANNLSNQHYLNHLSRYRLLNLPEQGRNFSIVLKIPLTYSI